MHRKWMVKLGTPILALALVSACGTADNNNNEVPQDINAPGKESPNDNDTHNDQDVPDNDVDKQDVEKNNDQDPDMNNDNGRRN